MKKILVLSLLAASAASFAVEQTGAGFTIADLATQSSSITLATGASSINYVRFNGMTHTWVGDIIATVNGVSMMNRTGATAAGNVGSASDLNGNYTFAAAGANFWTAATSSPVASGTYMSSNALSGGAGNGFITGSYAAGTVFTLVLSDNAAGDVGNLQSWTIGYTAVPEPATMAALGLGAVALIRRRRSK